MEVCFGKFAHLKLKSVKFFTPLSIVTVIQEAASEGIIAFLDCTFGGSLTEADYKIRSLSMKWLYLLVLALALAVTPVQARPNEQAPRLTGTVTDSTGNLSSGRREIEQKVSEVINSSNGRLKRIFILFTQNKGGFADSNAYGIALFKENQLEEGVVVITVTFGSPREILITVSPELTSLFVARAPNGDGTHRQYIISQMTPLLRAGKYKEAVLSAVTECGKIVSQVQAQATTVAQPIQIPAAPVVATPTEPVQVPSDSILICLVSALVIAFLAFVVWLLKGNQQETEEYEPVRQQRGARQASRPYARRQDYVKSGDGEADDKRDQAPMIFPVIIGSSGGGGYQGSGGGSSYTSAGSGGGESSRTSFNYSSGADAAPSDSDDPPSSSGESSRTHFDASPSTDSGSWGSSSADSGSSSASSSDASTGSATW